MSVRFRPLLAGDVVQLQLQPSQHVTLGLVRPVLSMDDGRELEQGGGEAWTAYDPGTGRILALAGLGMLWPATDQSGGHAIAWALLSSGLGARHVAITRFLKGRVEASSCDRIEAVVRADVAAECRWAALVGLELVAPLPAWGPEAKDHLLFQRIRRQPPIELVDLHRRAPRLEALGAV